MEHYHDPNGRMPRACKRGRPAQGEIGKPSRRGRKPKNVSTPMDVPNAYSIGESNHSHQQLLQQQLHQQQLQHQQLQHQQQQQQLLLQQQQHHQLQQQQELAASYSRSERIRAVADIAERQSSRYCTRTQVNQHSTPYSQTNQRTTSQAAANQVLYPNISHVPRTTATYTLPEQLPQLTSMSYTRGTSHNLPLSTAPIMERFWRANTARPPVTTPAPPQIINPAPVAPLPPHTCDNNTQTDYQLPTADEEKLLQLIREKKMDVTQIDIIIRNDDHIVAYTEPIENQCKINNESLNKIVEQSDKFKSALTTIMSSGLRTPAVNPVLQVLAANHNIPSMSGIITPGTDPPTSPQEAQDAADNLTSHTNESTSNNDDDAAPHPQVPQHMSMPADNMQYFTAPPVPNHNFDLPRPRLLPRFANRLRQNQDQRHLMNVPADVLRDIAYSQAFVDNNNNRSHLNVQDEANTDTGNPLRYNKTSFRHYRLKKVAQSRAE